MRSASNGVAHTTVRRARGKVRGNQAKSSAVARPRFTSTSRLGGGHEVDLVVAALPVRHALGIRSAHHRGAAEELLRDGPLVPNALAFGRQSREVVGDARRFGCPHDRRRAGSRRELRGLARQLGRVVSSQPPTCRRTADPTGYRSSPPRPCCWRAPPRRASFVWPSRGAAVPVKLLHDGHERPPRAAAARALAVDPVAHAVHGPLGDPPAANQLAARDGVTRPTGRTPRAPGRPSALPPARGTRRSRSGGTDTPYGRALPLRPGSRSAPCRRSEALEPVVTTSVLRNSPRSRTRLSPLSQSATAVISSMKRRRTGASAENAAARRDTSAARCSASRKWSPSSRNAEPAPWRRTVSRIAPSSQVDLPTCRAPRIRMTPGVSGRSSRPNLGTETPPGHLRGLRAAETAPARRGVRPTALRSRHQRSRR